MASETDNAPESANSPVCGRDACAVALTGDLESLLDEAQSHPMVGWDFSWLSGRLITASLPWDFADLVSRRTAESPDLLDLGTGGGEWLAALGYRPPRVVATESWEPNLSVATERLEPLGIPVVQVPPAVDNEWQSERDAPCLLPFLDASFHLITNRHASYVAPEISRVLAPGGHFLTQQVAAAAVDDLDQLLGVKRELPAARWTLDLAQRQLRAAGLRPGNFAEGVEEYTFLDAAALAWYAKVCPWWYPNLDIEAERPKFRVLQERIKTDGPLTITAPHFWVEAIKP